MKKVLSLLVIIFFIINEQTKSQPLPVMADTSIHVRLLMQVKPNAVRLAKNPVNNSLYYATHDGRIYKIKKPGGVYSDTLVATPANHYINYLQCIIFKDSNIYLIGNHVTPNVSGYGLIMRGKFQPNNSWIWDTLMHTANYPVTATTYDHSFSCICLSVNGDSLYFNSGSRTDHGEIESDNGLFPNTREVPLTAKIFRIPINPPSTIYLPNDSTSLAASGYIFCNGVRNSFDLQFSLNGDLIGCENSGDADDPEELNWLQQGKHYGFPWKMGGDTTGMQFPNYNENTDLLINHQGHGWKKNIYYNDPAYPQVPAGLTLTEPIKNYGPDADKFRDKQTGQIRDASSEGTYITSFTGHRSELGLTFDYAGKLSAPYYKSAFILNYTAGTIDSSGVLPNGNLGPFVDVAQDLLQVALFKDSVTGLYSMNCYRIGSNFINSVDGYLENNKLYIIETQKANSATLPGLYEITFPLNTSTSSCPFLGKDSTICSGNAIKIIPNLKGQFNYQWSNGATTAQLIVVPPTTTTYWVNINNGITFTSDTIVVTIIPKPDATITTTGPTTFCATTNPLTLTAQASTNYTYQWKKGYSYISGATSPTYMPTASGTYKVEVKHQNGCTKQSPGIAVTVNPLPVATITAQGPATFCAGGSVVLHSSNGTTYQWTRGTTNLATTQNYTATQQGTYKVTVTDVNNCSKTSAGKKVTVNCRGATPFVADDVEIDLNPNPVSGDLSITFDLNERQVKIEVLDANGNIVIQKNGASADGYYDLQLNVSDLSAGVYSVLVKTEKKNYIKSL